MRAARGLWGIGRVVRKGSVCWVVGWGGCRIEESCRGGGDGGEAVDSYWVCHVGLNWILESEGGGDGGRIRVI